MPLNAYTDDAGEIRWRAKARNNRTVADSAEGYGGRRDVLDGIRATLRAILDARNSDLADGPLEGFDIESTVRLAVADYLNREASLLTSTVVAPEVVDAIRSGSQLVIVSRDVLDGFMDGPGRSATDEPLEGPESAPELSGQEG